MEFLLAQSDYGYPPGFYRRYHAAVILLVVVLIFTWVAFTVPFDRTRSLIARIIGAAIGIALSVIDLLILAFVPAYQLFLGLFIFGAWFSLPKVKKNKSRGTRITFGIIIGACVLGVVVTMVISTLHYWASMPS